jgi:hypothetical protein
MGKLVSLKRIVAGDGNTSARSNETGESDYVQQICNQRQMTLEAQQFRS